MNMILFVTFISLVICLILIFVGLLFSFLKEEGEKIFVLESGFSVIDNKFFLFSIQFFLILVIFILFDLEIVFLISLLNFSLSNILMIFCFILFVILTLFMEFFWGKLKWFV